MASPVTQAYSRIGLGTDGRVVVPAIRIPDTDIPPHPDYVRNYEKWIKIRDCFAGEDVIKLRRQLYLPKLSAHKDEEYDAYLKRAYFYNAVRRTAVGLMGSLFRKPPEFTLPPQATIPADNITLEGQDLAEFTREAASEVVLTGRYGILVDFPERRPDEAIVGPPYLAGYNAENIYSWRVRLIRGRKVLDRVILREERTTFNDYGEVWEEVVRVLRLDEQDGQLVYSQEIWEWPNEAEAGDPTMRRVTPLSLGRPLSYIPFVFVNVTHNLPAVQDSPLSDIATLNIQHYQSTALLQHARFYAGMPTYVTSAGDDVGGGDTGLPDGMKTLSALTVGPSNVWELEKGAKAWILEFNGHGLTFLENAVDSLQLQMQSLGGKLISAQRRAAALSSEAWALLETGDEATLLDVALTLERGISTALEMMSSMKGDPTPKGAEFLVELNKEFVRTDLTARELRALQSLYERQIIPLDVMYYALREVNVIPVEYSLEDFKGLMSKKDQLYEPPVVESFYTGTSRRAPAGAAPASGATGTQPPQSRPPANNGGGNGTGG